MDGKKGKHIIVFPFLLLFCGVFLNSYLKSQSYSQIIDSLVSGKTVEEQLKSLDNYYMSIRFIDLTLAAKVCDTALEIASSSSDEKLLAHAQFNKGTILLLFEEYDSALIYYNNSIKNCLLVEDSVGLFKAKRNISVIYQNLGKYDEAIKILKENLQFSKRILNNDMTISNYWNLGNVQYMLGNYSTALKYYDSANALINKVNDLDSKFRLLGNIGAIYDAQGKFDKALQYYYKSLNWVDSLHQWAAKAAMLKNIGGVYLQTGENMKALDVLFESYYLRDSLNLRNEKASTLLLIGKAYEFEGNYQRANEMYIQGLKILQEFNNMRQVAHALTYIGKNLHLQEEYENALSYYRTSLEVAKDHGLKLEISENYKHLVLLYGEMNVEDSVFKYIDLFADVKAEMKVDFEEPEIIHQSQKTMLAEQAESEIDNDAKKLIIVNWLVISIIILGLVVFIFLLLSFNMQLKHKKNRN